jgi:hypothetical protein
VLAGPPEEPTQAGTEESTPPSGTGTAEPAAAEPAPPATDEATTLLRPDDGEEPTAPDGQPAAGTQPAAGSQPAPDEEATAPAMRFDAVPSTVENPAAPRQAEEDEAQRTQLIPPRAPGEVSHDDPTQRWPGN